MISLNLLEINKIESKNLKKQIINIEPLKLKYYKNKGQINLLLTDKK